MGKGSAGKRYPGVEARGDSIRLRFNWRGRRSETLQLAPTPANLKIVSDLRTEIRRHIALGTFDYKRYFPNSPHAQVLGGVPAKTFIEVSETMLATSNLAKSTREGYRKSLKRYAWPRFGTKPIDRITELDILEALALVDASMKTRNNTLVPISRTFALARLPIDPTAGIDYGKHQNPTPDPFSPEDVEPILAMIQKRYGSIVNYFGFGFFAGPRPSEHIPMMWDDLDLRSGEWLVRRAKVRREEKATKTYHERVHKLSSKALSYLEAQRAETQLRSPYVFLDPVTGEVFNDDKPPRERYWRPVLSALKIRYRPPEQMRHTYITMAIMSGANPVWVAKQAGNSPRVIFKHYARWIDRVGGDKEAAKVEEALGTFWSNDAEKKA